MRCGHNCGGYGLGKGPRNAAGIFKSSRGNNKRRMKWKMIASKQAADVFINPPPPPKKM